jgi:exosortase
MDLVILAGSVGKGAAWTRGCIKSLLPLPAKGTLIEALIRHFDQKPTRKCIICSDGHKAQFVKRTDGLKTAQFQIEYFEDSVPLGTAGCLKACEHRTDSQTVMLAGGSVWVDDDPEWMLEQHRLQGNALTVFCTKDPGWAGMQAQQYLRPAGLFCCDRSVFKYIRPSGFQDLKEQLVPALKKAGLRVGAVALTGGTCEVSDPAIYMDIIARVLSEGRFHSSGFARIAPDIWCGRNIQIASHVKLVGPLLLGHDCKVEEGAVIVGPTMLGDSSHVGRNARLIRVVAAHRLRVRPGLYLTDRVLTAPQSTPPIIELKSATAPVAVRPMSLWERAWAWPRKLAAPATAVGAALFAAFVWAFWASINNLWNFLGANADYSAGQLVPVAALYMVVAHKERWNPSFRFWWPGLGVFAFGALANMFGYSFRYGSIENFGLITAGLGVLASIVGPAVCSRIWYPLLFLFLMVPLPHRVHSALMVPLQGWGANIAATVLETLGIPAVRTGNVIQVAGHQIAVAEACSGLRMVLAFLIVTGVIAYLIKRPN